MTRVNRRAVAAALTATLTLSAGACISTSAPARVGLTADSPNVTASARQVAVSLDDLAGLWLGAVEWRGDRIRAASGDPEVRRNALLWKVNASGAMLRATSHSDALIAFLDAWTLVLQFKAYFEDGAGAEMFGEYTPIATELIILAEAEIERLAHSLASPEGVANGRQVAIDFAAREPIANPYFVRRSTAAEIVALLSESRRDAFAQLGTITDTVESLSAQLSLYAAYLPKLARWQAELLLEDPSTSGMLAGVIDDVAGIDAAAARVADKLDHAVDYKLDEVLNGALAQIATELDEIETLVDRQRLRVLDQLPAEYERIFEKVTEQRIEALLQVEAKIDEALDRVDAVAERTLGDAEGLTHGTVDYAFERAMPLLIGAFFGLLILILVYRLVPQRVRQN